jgi:predicted DNA-binding transcriptional regulator YafY
MAKTLIRYWAYDKCLQNKGIRYTWQDLQNAANQSLDSQDYEPIGKTQFFQDIKNLKAPPWMAPIETYKSGGQSYYRYSDPDYSIRKQELSEAEAGQVRSALMVLSRFKGMPQFEWVHELIPKIEQSFKLAESREEIIGFEQNVDLKGMNYFGELFNAILFRKVLKIKYKSFTRDQVIEQIIYPYYLKQYNNRWFLFGKNPNYEEITNMPLDRIEGEIVYISETFIDNTQYNFDEYFEDIIGVTRPSGKPVEKVKLWFSPAIAPYIHTKPLHGTQKEHRDESGMIVTIEVIPNYELEQVLLRYGENCKVMEPSELRDKIATRLRAATDNYQVF